MAARKILIAGSGIAGPTLAYWLSHHGFEPTIVESAPSLRKGGYIIDFWGVGYDVADKMQLLPELRTRGYSAGELRLVDRQGERVGGFNTDILQSSLGNRFLSIPRGELAAAIYDKVEGKVETIFGDNINSITDFGKGVQVSFQHAASRYFDLVIGADGLHSAVRGLTFGPGNQFEKNLGYFVAAFSADDYKPRDEGAYVCYSTPGKQVARFALRNNRTVFFLIFSEKNQDAEKNEQSNKERLAEVFANDGWECAEIIKSMQLSTDLYCDSVSQIRMPTWSKGRVALVGDAAYCPSLLAGQGAALAMAGGYVLAGELKEAKGDHLVAFERYEKKLKSFIFEKQKGAERFGSWFAPATSFGIFVRNQIANMLAVPVIGDCFVRASIADRLTLSDY